MRQNYLDAVKALSSHQKEIEAVISNVLKNYYSIHETQLLKTYSWVKESVKKREEYLNTFKEKLYESLLIMPSIEDVFHNSRFDELKSYIIDFYKKSTL